MVDSNAVEIYSGLFLSLLPDSSCSDGDIFCPFRSCFPLCSHSPSFVLAWVARVVRRGMCERYANDDAFSWESKKSTWYTPYLGWLAGYIGCQNGATHSFPGCVKRDCRSRSAQCDRATRALPQAQDLFMD